VKVVEIKWRTPRRVVGGRDVGLKGSVVPRIGDDYLVLELSRSGEKVKVRLVMLLNWVLRRKKGV